MTAKRARTIAATSLLCVVAVAATAQTPQQEPRQLSEQPIEAPGIKTEHGSQSTTQPEQTAEPEPKTAAQPAPVKPSVLSPGAEGKGQAKAENGGEEGTEFWPTFAGLKLKITDTILAVFTAGLFFATYALWLATRALVRGSDKTAVRQLRPYITLKPFIHKPELNAITEHVEAWSFRCIWNNVGSTPTKHMITRTGLLRKYGEEPLDFEKDITSKVPGNPGRLFLGPGNEAASEKFFVTTDEILAVVMNGLQIYLWGCADYSDTFDKKSRHRTEFFVKIIAVGDPRSKDCGIGYQIYGPFNGIDDECYGKPEPYDTRPSI